MAKSKRNHWMRRHLNDSYVQRSQKDGFRSRAAYKLLEINERDRLIKPGMTVVDLGACPGGWTQVLSDIVGDNGRVIALDVLPMDPFANVEIIQGDFQDQEVLDRLLDVLDGKPVDLVISDMAPNISGVRAVDQPKSMYLAELALAFAAEVLKPKGDFLTKVFAGEGIDEYRREIRTHFKQLLTRKPKSSRSESREFFLLGRDRIAS